MAGGGHLHTNLTIGQRDLNAGMVRMLDVDPRDANVFVMAVGDGPWWKGGVFVSRDGGISFRRRCRCATMQTGRAA